MNIMEKYFNHNVSGWDYSKVYRWIVSLVIVTTCASFSISILTNHYTIMSVLNILILIDASLSASFGCSSAATFEEWWTQTS